MRVLDARETERIRTLDGVKRADFRQRAIAFAIDVVLAVFSILAVLLLAGLAVWGVRVMQGHPEHLRVDFRGEQGKLLQELIAPILYFGLFTYWGNGRTPGKRLLGIRVVSLVHERMNLWHSIERALGYGAATLEFGFGFLQFFLHPYRRTASRKPSW